MTQSTHASDDGGRPGFFPTTHWSVVVEAVDQADPEGLRALEYLCQSYWYPLYAYVRRKGYAPADAEDLTQEFFARFVHKNYLSSVDKKKGCFRSFLVASLEHFLAKEWNRAHRVKRGGRFSFISFDEEMAERRYDSEPREEASAEALYDRSWALVLLEKAMDRLKKEYTEAGKGEVFEQLRGFLSADREDQKYAEAAARLQVSQGAARVAVHRLRARYGAILRETVAETLVRPDEIDAELKYLLSAVGQS